VDVILECSYKTFGKISQVALVLWSRGIKRNADMFVLLH